MNRAQRDPDGGVSLIDEHLPWEAGIVVVGYASLDHSMALTGFNGMDATSIIDKRLSSAWPKVGGIAHIVQAAVKYANGPTCALSWVGPDSYGKKWLAAVQNAGVDVEGVAVTGTRSPSAYIMYVEQSGALCFFDPADCHRSTLSPQQERMLKAAKWCLVNVGPQFITRRVLEIIPDSCKLVWAVKQDEEATPRDLVVALLERANIVSFSQGERGFLAAGGVPVEGLCAPGTLLLETQGARGVKYCFTTGVVDSSSVRPKEPEYGFVPAVPIESVDTTGAGDTFIGSLIGMMASDRIQCDSKTENYIKLATEEVAEMLKSRIKSNEQLTR